MAFEKNPARTEALAKLVEWLGGLPREAHVLSWVEIQQATSIDMSSPPAGSFDGRGLVREALHKIRREYLPLPGRGVELSSAQTSSDILVRRIAGTLRSVKRADRARDNLASRHGDEMTAAQRDAFARESARLSTLTMLASPPQSRKLRR